MWRELVMVTHIAIRIMMWMFLIKQALIYNGSVRENKKIFSKSHCWIKINITDIYLPVCFLHFCLNKCKILIKTTSTTKGPSLNEFLPSFVKRNIYFKAKFFDQLQTKTECLSIIRRVTTLLLLFWWQRPTTNVPTLSYIC